MPPLSDLMPAELKRQTQRQSAEEQLSIALRWNAHLGGQVLPMDSV